MERYFAIVAQQHKFQEAEQLASKTAEALELKMVLRLPGILFLTDGSMRSVPIEDAGVLIGTVFRRNSGFESVEKLTPEEQEAILRSEGERLVDTFWGSFVALFKARTDQSAQIVRSIFGSIPCYYISYREMTILGSNVELFVEAGFLRPEIDWRQIGRHLVAPNLRTPETCLMGVTELLGGFRLSIATQGSFAEQLWSPWDYCQSSDWISDEAIAIAELRETVLATTAAWARDSGHVVLGISGGLDSSIVAASLAHAGTPFTCLSLYTRDAAGDERSYARLVADKFGVELFEEFEDWTSIDLTLSHAAHLPRPIARSFAQSGDKANLSVASQVGAGSFFSGGGGDNVFCYLQSAAPVADRLLADGFGYGVWKTAADVGRLADCSVWEALSKGARRAWLRKPDYRWRAETRFLNEEVARGAANARPHPWSKTPRGGLPGKASHVAWLIGIQNFIEGFDRERMYVMRWPLLSQPLVELCLRMPSWLWCNGGHNRVIAREAFRCDLPQEIIDRRSKGTPDSFVVEIFEHHREIIRSQLMEGVLAANGILDLAAIDAVLNDHRPARGFDYWRIMKLVDVEAWARAWIARPLHERPVAARGTD